MNSPIKYFGGKNGIAKKIISYFPNDKNIQNYIEPFGGSAALLFNLQKPYPIEIYNDLEDNVYALFKVLVDQNLFKQFKQLCDLSLFSEKMNKEYKEKIKNNDISLVDRAYMFYYVNRSSYNGVGSFSASTVVRRKMSKQVSDFLSSIDGLYEVHNRLSKVVVYNKDGIDIIKKFDKKNTLMYLDPPYVQSTRSSARYKVDMDDEKHLELLNALINIKNAYVLLSGYDNEGYGCLEENGWKKHSFEVKTQSGKRESKTKKEFLWTNY